MATSGTHRWSTRTRLLLPLMAVVLLSVVGWSIYFALDRPRVVNGSLTVGTKVRHFRLAIPRASSGGPRPLVFAFHGAGGSPDGLARQSGWDRVANRHGLLVVYPQASRLWAVPGTANDEQLKRDLLFYDRLGEHLAETYEIDRERIYAIGMSHGASFAQYLAHQRPATLAAVVAHSHPPPAAVWQHDPPKAVPLMLIIGELDRQASAASVERAAVNYRDRGHDVELIVLTDWGHRWDRKLNPAMVRFLLSHELGAE